MFLFISNFIRLFAYISFYLGFLMIKATYNSTDQYLDVIYSGEITADEIIEHGRSLVRNSSLPLHLNILTDARYADYSFGNYDLKRIRNALQENLKAFKSLRNAFVHNKPKETAYSQIVQSSDQNHSYQHKVFSTRERALQWLLNQR